LVVANVSRMICIKRATNMYTMHIVCVIYRSVVLLVSRLNIICQDKQTLILILIERQRLMHIDF
jgi:hypothetical protein